jgi:hypothetical protein
LGDVIADAEEAHQLTVLVIDSLVSPGDPHPLAITQDVFVLGGRVAVRLL